MKLKLGIVGHGFVGSAVDYAFTTEDVKKFILQDQMATIKEVQKNLKWTMFYKITNQKKKLEKFFL